MKNKSLYVMAHELEALEELLIMDQGEMTDGFGELEEELSKAITMKIDAIGDLVQKFEDEIETAKAHEKRIRDWRSHRENAINRIKSNMIQVLERLPEMKIKGELYSASIRKPALSVSVHDEAALPMDYIKTVVTPDKTAIAKALKNGESVEGACLVEGKKSVMLKMKAVK